MIALLGFGKTNQALLELCNHQGTQCLIFDDSFAQIHTDTKQNHYIPSQLFDQYIHQIDFAIPSPGIPPHHPLIAQSPKLISEYDYILPNIRQPQIWISGTNGKTTTTEMLEHLLSDFGGVAGGNIGRPLAELLHLQPKIWILETSSFTLHYTHQSTPQIYLLLPLSQDHISWHKSFGNYTQAKLSPLANMRPDATAIIPQQYISHPIAQASQATIIGYTSEEDLKERFGIDSAIPFDPPFLLDALLAIIGAKLLTQCDLSAKLQDYRLGAHKMEKILDARGRLWINDSKGTNIDATIWALRTYKHQKVFLILGGDDKGADLAPLFAQIRLQEVEILAIGSNASRIQKYADRYAIQCTRSLTLDRAVRQIHAHLDHQSVAILSPAAASLDQFVSYRQRGERFVELVKDLS
ncbi:hypothetical protein BBW65_05945 [Helicobacter enhydrae]|uniref:UDP-N-acetylmuramoylalanine--D-glutamate ligase n=1 Tax=Helicobacter enhydrae TaxID=222136 RepID=A0A1B1U6K1_9HELI|nr:UDP-N-acetylmuramoyl-L-alanine--D-glutamate ligase [Helicobacter enhydrae]ANV98366.1 hypothetical protein BBW65_05945 [Helicobacter enhydrae]